MVQEITFIKTNKLIIGSKKLISILNTLNSIETLQIVNFREKTNNTIEIEFTYGTDNFSDQTYFFIKNKFKRYAEIFGIKLSLEFTTDGRTIGIFSISNIYVDQFVDAFNIDIENGFKF